MRLTTIKLAGFKSFVDPTTLHLPTNMTGVVGPNGCGKSNIIDAIRWVMGESAASRLRGDSLTDVIFSGSGARKPVGQALVELVFDNSDGTVQGEFANYNEISVKRVVTRDGQSQYFLNGAHCRRRDITDLFLGTGLGPRSYSIIEQGMISQIIEAHPEQLRVYLEEAAGISKYKERRRETENRIKATRENLDRVRDVREEVDKQLEHLDRQARAAERWKKLKEQQQRKEAELRAVEYRDIHRQRDAEGSGLGQVQVQIEKAVADQREVEAQLEKTREAHRGAGEHLNAVQADVYKVGAEIARVEQQLQHNREMKERMERTRAEVEREHAELTGHVDADREQAAMLRGALAEGEPQRAALEQRQAATAQALQEAEARQAAWQSRWDEHAREAAGAARSAEVERTRLDYLDRQSVDNARRCEALASEQRTFDVDALDRAAAQLAGERDRQQAAVESLGATLEQHKLRHAALQDEERGVQDELNGARKELETARGRLASLEALQHAALGQEDSAAGAWLARLGLDQAPRLGAALQVEAGWETAVETVLAGFLDGVLVASPHALANEFADLSDANVALLDASGEGSGNAGTLAGHVRGPDAIVGFLGHVLTADTLADADRRLAGLSALAPYQSVITRAGEWLGPGWARVHRANDNQLGILAREREIKELGARVVALESRVAEQAGRVQSLRAERAQAEQLRDDAQRDLYQAHRRASELAGQLQSQRGRVETARARTARVTGELQELATAQSALAEQARAARANLDQAVARMAQFEEQRGALEAERRALLEAREEARMNAREASEQAHTLALGMESRRTALAALDQALARMGAQLEQLQARRAQIDEQLAHDVDPGVALEAERQTCLDQRLLVDKQLVEARRAVETHDAEFRRLDQERQRIEQQLEALREQHSEQRLKAQALDLRAQQLAEAIAASGQELEPLLAELPADADPAARASELESLAARIVRLEPVNLAAIQEYEEQSQRRTYLDSQLDDLTAALETLEGAIRKIDRETRQRFKETFEKVNTGMQELFPRLFGGGHAYLELTGEDLLDTGVAIMARPPGKRVSNISLLSGGEKAMTAVALVFAIFRLNPAPFCLLDEVDAPLDEANVGRFSSMVEEMSEHVQFIFISHNKSTMEAARQLCGVTMREAGVSRLVQVDLAEAAQLAGAA